MTIFSTSPDRCEVETKQPGYESEDGKQRRDEAAKRCTHPAHPKSGNCRAKTSLGSPPRRSEHPGKPRREQSGRQDRDHGAALEVDLEMAAPKWPHRCQRRMPAAAPLIDDDERHEDRNRPSEARRIDRPVESLAQAGAEIRPE